jgi:hypothetical protein
MGGAGTYPLTVVGVDGEFVEFGTSELVLECTPDPPPCCETLDVTIDAGGPPYPVCYTNTPPFVNISITFSACNIQWRIYRYNCEGGEDLYSAGAGIAPVVNFFFELGEGEAWNGGALCPEPVTRFRIRWWCGDLDPDVDSESGSLDILDVTCA